MKGFEMNSEVFEKIGCVVFERIDDCFYVRSGSRPFVGVLYSGYSKSYVAKKFREIKNGVDKWSSMCRMGV